LLPSAARVSPFPLGPGGHSVQYVVSGLACMCGLPKAIRMIA